jgi:hypothetical protein
MKHVVYASRTRGFDGRIFVVRTVNKHHLHRDTQEDGLQLQQDDCL